ncbi:MAG: dihydroneopterin aldolase [Rickettsiales bacterium]|nr:dihydroneopterin aldolase [Rickettsiales bacterium]
MSSDTNWNVTIKNLETRIRVGIHPHEQEPQRVIVNATISGDFPVRPQSIEDCFNYDLVHQLVAKKWPTEAHIPLLESWVTNLLLFIFKADPRVTQAKVSVCKPDIFDHAESVGVEAIWSRADFKRFNQ